MPEFVAMMVAKFNTMNKGEEMVAAFKEFDVNGDGFITKREMDIALERMGDVANKKQIQKVFKNVDKDNDGRINYSEFVAMINSTFE